MIMGERVHDKNMIKNSYSADQIEIEEKALRSAAEDLEEFPY